MNTWTTLAAALCGVTASLLSISCSAPSLMTVTVSESETHVVRLQAVPDANAGRGYSHPAFLSEETVAAVLTGLLVEEETSLVPLAFQRRGSGERSRALGEAEVKLLSPLLAKGLSMATPEELVTFFETADISPTQRVITSGGVFVIGDELHIVLSNHAAKVNIWQDADSYAAPYRMTPLEPISPEPARLIFEPARLMASPRPWGLGDGVGGASLRAAVRYKEVPTSTGATSP